MDGSGQWQYSFVWTPGEAFSTYRLVAVRRNGQLQTWDTFTAKAFLEAPKVTDVLNNLYLGVVESFERFSHLQG